MSTRMRAYMNQPNPSVFDEHGSTYVNMARVSQAFKTMPFTRGYHMRHPYGHPEHRGLF
jgi:hypothetical protein